MFGRQHPIERVIPQTMDPLATLKAYRAQAVRRAMWFLIAIAVGLVADGPGAIEGVPVERLTILEGWLLAAV